MKKGYPFGIQVKLYQFSVIFSCILSIVTAYSLRTYNIAQKLVVLVSMHVGLYIYLYIFYVYIYICIYIYYVKRSLPAGTIMLLHS